jgi:hypothetical protein
VLRYPLPGLKKKRDFDQKRKHGIQWVETMQHASPHSDAQNLFVPGVGVVKSTFVWDPFVRFAEVHPFINATSQKCESDMIAVRINELHTSWYLGHFKRREMQVLWKQLKQVTDAYRRVQFVQYRQKGYNKKTLQILKNLRKAVHDWSVPKRLVVKQGLPLPFELRRDLFKKGWILMNVNQSQCPNLVAGDRLVTGVLPGQYPLLWTMGFNQCCKWLNDQVIKSDIILEFNVVQEEGHRAAALYQETHDRVSEMTFEKMTAVAQKDSPSPYQGVLAQAWHRSNLGEPFKYIARVHYNGKIVYLGKFDTAVDAARAHDVASRKYHGSQAKLNFPSEDAAPLSTCPVSGTPCTSEQPQADLIPFFKGIGMSAAMRKRKFSAGSD